MSDPPPDGPSPASPPPSAPGLSEARSWLAEGADPTALPAHAEALRRLLGELDSLLLQCAHVLPSQKEAELLAIQVQDAIHAARASGVEATDERLATHGRLWHKLERLAHHADTRHLLERVRHMVDS